MHFTFKMDLTASGASFTTTHNSMERAGKYTTTKDNIVIEYDKKDKRIYDIETDFSNDITEERVTRLLDKKGKELFFAYRQETASIETIEENVYSKNYSMPHINYI